MGWADGGSADASIEGDGDADTGSLELVPAGVVEAEPLVLEDGSPVADPEGVHAAANRHVMTTTNDQRRPGECDRRRAIGSTSWARRVTAR
jgi:hypothetical protein